MVIAGIDEAGYGPVLGPLVVGCCALRLPEVSNTDAEDTSDRPPEPALPDVWLLLKRAVSRTRDSAGRKIHVNDSKKVYSPNAGLLELEKSILALAATRSESVSSFDDFLKNVAPESVDWLAEREWYRAAESETFPAVVHATVVAIQTNAISVEMKRARIAVEHLNAFIVPEHRLNPMFAATRNKSETSMSFVVRHIDTLLNRYGSQGLFIHCDKQGGRTHYGPLLRQMFPDWSLSVVGESDQMSQYDLSRGTDVVKVTFAEKAEQGSFAVAVASMLSKYLREMSMRRFNAYWQSRFPGIKPTAGYYVDGKRFLQDLLSMSKASNVDLDLSTLERTR